MTGWLFRVLNVKFNIHNEYDHLDAVLVHRPGPEIDRLTHDNMERFLFEDIPFLKRMQDEHDAFVAAMRDRGVNVVYLEALLTDLLRDNSAQKEKLIQNICRTENVPAIADDLLDENKFPHDQLLDVLFAGISATEYQKVTGRGAPPTGRDNAILQPIPNAYFSRDPAVVVGNAVISCKMHYVERVRETLLTRAVLEHHPNFAGQPIAYGGTAEPTEDRPFTVEGGDVLVINDETVFIGASERTRSETIERLASKIFANGKMQRVYEIPIPTERTFMHLDTVFTCVDRQTVVWYPGVMEHIKYIHHYEPDANGNAARKADSRNLDQILSDEFGGNVNIVRTGGGDEHYASREQRTDGTNTLALAPRVACTYERNTRTIAAMEKAGIECVEIQGSELVRGLGGPRCMTMPLRRVKK